MAKILVTAALPYANGPLHLGHLASTYLPSDIFSRYHRLKGNDIVFVCASDEHGTPIQINAEKAGVKPEEFVKKFHAEHSKDFDAMGVSFDMFYHTHSPENQKMSDYFFECANKAGAIFKKKVLLTYCENCKRYLPDRYVKGECPACGASDQYGDVCEACGKTHAGGELKNPKCAICGKTPIKKENEHYFFKLALYEKRLKEYLESNKNLQKSVKNYVSGWLKDGLKDWDITRNGPYFGFKIPGEEDKYYYVWLDAPIGYVSSTVKWAEGANRKWEDFWKSKDSRIVHFIGKDIIYFHYLFWPALLMAAGLNLPSAIPTRGYLTVDSEKMSKSRGTFILLKDYLARFSPDYLRYYLTTSTPNSTVDVNFSWSAFQSKCNSDLSDAFGNFVHRTLTFISARYEGVVPKPSALDERDIEFQKKMDSLPENVAKHMDAIELKRALEEIMAFTHECNKYFNEACPWKTIQEKKEKCDTTLYLCARAIGVLSVVLEPFIPDTAKTLQGFFGSKGASWDDAASLVSAGQKISEPTPLFKKIEDGEILEKGDSVKKDTVEPKTEDKGDPFVRMALRTGKIISAVEHPNADKLYVLGVDFGGEKRAIVAGIKGVYKIEELLDKKAVFLTNIKPTKIRGIESQGMVLVADDGKQLSLLFSDAEPGDVVLAEGVSQNPVDVFLFEDFQKNTMATTKDNGVVVLGGALVCAGKKVYVENVSCGAKIR